MRTLLAVMLFSSLAFGAEPLASDVPLKEGDHVCGTRESDLDARGCATLLKKGDPAPYDALALDEQENVRRTRTSARSSGTLDKADDDVLVPKGRLAALIVGCIVFSAGASAAVTYVVLRK